MTTAERPVPEPAPEPTNVAIARDGQGARRIRGLGSEMDAGRQRKFSLGGWGLFAVSALFFILSALRSGDSLSLLGGLFFFVACIVFVIPLVTRPRD